MPDLAHVPPDPERGFADLPRPIRRKLMVLASMRAGLTVSILILAYFWMPFTLVSQTRYLTVFLLGVGVVAIALVIEFGRIQRSPYPRLRAVEALMTSGPLFVVVFATLHFVVGHLTGSAYTQEMTRLDALYFTVATFATVGFGDIAPTSQLARLIVLLQMVCGVLLVGVIARVLFGIAQHTERLRSSRGSA